MSVLIFSHNIYVPETYQAFFPCCHLKEEVKISFQLAIFLCSLQNAVLMWYHSHKRHVLQELIVSAYHRVLLGLLDINSRFTGIGIRMHGVVK